MAWSLFGTKPLSEPMLAYCQLDPKEDNFNGIFQLHYIEWKHLIFIQYNVVEKSSKRHPFCLGFNVLMLYFFTHNIYEKGYNFELSMEKTIHLSCCLHFSECYNSVLPSSQFPTHVNSSISWASCQLSPIDKSSKAPQQSHQQPWYWQHRMYISLSFLRRNGNNILVHHSRYIFMFPKINSARQVLVYL